MFCHTPSLAFYLFPLLSPNSPFPLTFSFLSTNFLLSCWLTLPGDLSLSTGETKVTLLPLRDLSVFFCHPHPHETGPAF